MRALAKTLLSFLALIVAAVPSAWSQDAAFRVTDLQLREPNVYATFICLNITSTLNSELNASIGTDDDGDGFLDLSLGLILSPFDTGGAGGALRQAQIQCVPPAETTTCALNLVGELAQTTYVNNGADPCFTPDPGNLRPYFPPISLPAQPCFAGDPVPFTLSLGGALVPLQASRISATYVSGAPNELINGVIEGFVTEADADNTVIPEDLPIVGGSTLSSLFPGGTGNCNFNDDRKIGPDGTTLGWWIYLNFTAEEVPFTGPTAVEGDLAGRFMAVSAHPNPFNPRTTLRYELDRSAHATLEIADARGRHVRSLVARYHEAGQHSIVWDGMDDAGAPVASGIYSVRLESDGLRESTKVALLR